MIKSAEIIDLLYRDVTWCPAVMVHPRETVIIAAGITVSAVLYRLTASAVWAEVSMAD